MYRRMDALVGETLRYVDEQTALFVLSDHGFRSFRRSVHLNSWLQQNGYLVLREPLPETGVSRPFFVDVDWSRTRAYALGLSGLYLNIRGREAQRHRAAGRRSDGVMRGDCCRLASLCAIWTAAAPVAHVYPPRELYRGPYLDAAPDLIVGYGDGYRVSWESAVGKVTGSILEDNPKAWSGDHCVDPVLVPGVLFSNLRSDGGQPGHRRCGAHRAGFVRRGHGPAGWMATRSKRDAQALRKASAVSVEITQEPDRPSLRRHPARSRWCEDSGFPAQHRSQRARSRSRR